MLIHECTLHIVDHFQGQFIVIAQENTPLTRFGNGRGVGQNIYHRLRRLLLQRHKQSRHQREMKRHVAFIAHRAVPEILHHIMRPLISLREQHPTRVFLIHQPAAALQKLMCRRKIFAVCAVFLKQIRHGIQPESVESQIQPETHRIQHLLLHFGILVIQIRLVREKSMPIVLPANRVITPV